ncbi:MAG: class I SAM-dependent methyltransferase [Archaeoglobaceae archaeon]
MSHVFDSSQKNILESDFRKKILPKEPVIEFISDLTPEDRGIALEVGSGSGYFTVVLARYFHKVYGIEVSKDMAYHTAKRLDDEKIKNVGLIVAERPQIDFEVDLVFFADVLHEVDDPQTYLDYRAKIVVVIDWKKDEQTSFGPPMDVRIPEERMAKMVENKGYKIGRIDAYQYHYFIWGESRSEGRSELE